VNASKNNIVIFVMNVLSLRHYVKAKQVCSYSDFDLLIMDLFDTMDLNDLPKSFSNM
jgi:hypothetical protein